MPDSGVNAGEQTPQCMLSAIGASAGLSAPVAGKLCVCASETGVNYWSQVQ